MNTYRDPTSSEKALLRFLIEKSGNVFSRVDDYKVKSLSDGNMGSLSLSLDDIHKQERITGREASNFQFNDIDGVAVIATLYLDKEGDLFELDIWKTDYSPLVRFPDL